MKFNTSYQVDFRNRFARDIGQEACEDLVLEMVSDAVERARQNVQPGFGPGPHPHPTEHVDTGALAAAIEANVDIPNDHEVVGSIGVSSEPEATYGAALELGWHTKNGAFYQYPWLTPAFSEAGGNRMVRRHGLVKAKTWVGGRRARRAGRR